MTFEERFDLLLERLEVQFATLHSRLDSFDKRETEQRAGLRLELNGIHETQKAQVKTLADIADGVASISADVVKIREGVTEQIRLEIAKQLDAHMPFTMRAAANGVAER